ncbi:MAG: hypothetical protein JWR09_1670, partial [Mucilaginibacter sp.]|nr:hypothetical protein [Mucilaginibacter sp.]
GSKYILIALNKLPNAVTVNKSILHVVSFYNWLLNVKSIK